MKLPSFQFYPGDWMKDPALRSVGYAARGLWGDMLCLMFESVRRGYLQHENGKPVTAEQLARMTGGSTDEVSLLLKELEDSGVFSRTNQGVIYSRRIVREEQLRLKQVEFGKQGGNPTLKGGDKGGLKAEANPNPTPSSSVSSSTSTSTSKTEKQPAAEAATKGLKTASDHTRVVAHVLATYKLKKGRPYPFNGASGRIVKECIATYGVATAMALWDIFLKTNIPWRDKDGKTVTPAFDMTVFRAKWTILIEDPEMKSLEAKYTPRTAPETKEIIGGFLKKFPEKENSQMNKVEAIKALEQFK